MADCFENTPYEDISICPNEEVQAGLSPFAYFLPAAFVQTFTLPVLSETSTLEQMGTIEADIVPITGKGFMKLDLQVDLNSVTTNLVGNKGNKKDSSTLTIFVPGTKAKVLGFKKLYKNVPGIWVVPDNNGKFFVVGTDKQPAYIDNLEITTGTTNEDNNGGTGTIISNSNLYEYTGDITLIPVEEQGG